MTGGLCGAIHYVLLPFITILYACAFHYRIRVFLYYNRLLICTAQVLFLGMLTRYVISCTIISMSNFDLFVPGSVLV